MGRGKFLCPLLVEDHHVKPITSLSIMLSGAAASLAAGSLAAEADQAVTSPLPQPVFDATAFLAKLDEIGLGDAHDLLDAISVPLQERYGVAVITA